MDDVCKVTHNGVDKRLETLEDGHDNHEKRLGRLEQYKSKSEEQINNLCKQIGSLVTTIRWFIGAIFGSLSAFFIWYVQQLK